MAYQGKIKTNTLRAPLNALDLEDNSPVVDANNKIQKWFKENV
jgi:hypothetical protein